MKHFNWFQLIPQVGHEYTHIAVFLAVTALAVVLGLTARVALGSGEKAYVPAGHFSIKGVFETIMDFIVDLSNNVLGEDGKKYAPFVFTLFTVILLNNFFGLLPGLTPATDNINTNLAIGLCVFILYNALGLIENGVDYLKHFMGPMLALAPLMVVVELISHMIRPLSLAIRLKANMQADHLVVSAFANLAPPFTNFVIPVPFVLLGMFVCFMQAFVFTLLTLIYISLATAHDH